MQNLQYDLFTERTAITAEESHIFRQELKHVMDSSDRVRRGIFARLSEQGKIILKLIQEIDELKSKKRADIIPIGDENDLFRKKSKQL